MLPTIVREAERGLRDVPPHARWSAAIHELREALAQTPDLSVVGLAGFLDGIPDDDAPAAVRDLIAEHMSHGWRTGRSIPLERYVAGLRKRFESLASLASVPADLVEDEFLARHTLPGGDMPTDQDYVRRFPGRDDVMALIRARCLCDGRYVKLRRLGRGAVGEVFVACDRRRQRLVAIKQLRAVGQDSPEIRSHFVREAAITAGLDHPGVVHVYETVAECDTVPFYVMQLVRGRMLGEEIREYHFPTSVRSRRESRCLWYRLLRAFATVCDAMVHAHDRGVLHRDLKPGNIMLADSGEAVVLDWGMATRMHDGSGPPERGSKTAPTTAAVVGTPEYMPPELARGLAGEGSDVFGLGAVLYEILTGRPPHDWDRGVRPPDWRRVVLAARVSRPRKSNSRVSKMLESICLTALARDPADRYRSVRGMGQALQSHLHREVDPVKRGWRLAVGCRRLWRLVAP